MGLEENVEDHRHAQVTPLHRDGVPREALSSSDLRRITTVHPRSYNDARNIGEAFRAGTPVIMNLSDMDDADAKRLEKRDGIALEVARVQVSFQGL